MNDKPTPKPEPKPASKRQLRLGDYPHQIRDIVRFRDMDAQGHVNNAVYSIWFESGRVAMLREPESGLLDGTFALVRAEIDFRRELRWPGEVVVGSGIAQFGNRSFVLEQAVFQGEDCAATARMVLVAIDPSTRRPMPLPPELIAKLSPWKLREIGELKPAAPAP